MLRGVIIPLAMSEAACEESRRWLKSLTDAERAELRAMLVEVVIGSPEDGIDGDWLEEHGGQRWWRFGVYGGGN